MTGLFPLLQGDVSCIFERDPAAKTLLEVLLCYPGLHALWLHRLSHWLWTHHCPLTARILSQVGRFITGIEIHPGAQIGPRCFIDHGMGVVIGETTLIGKDVTLYQGVTLGGTGKDKGKRHPTIEDNVFIGASANILGNIVIGENSRVGAGSVVLQDVPPNSTVVGIPGRLVLQEGQRILITDLKDIPDPMMDSLESLNRQVQSLRAELAVLTR